MIPEHDLVGYWSEIKLEIVSRYATEYSKILANQSFIKKHIYIDAFAGPGVNLSRTTGAFIAGSPLNALNVHPPFKEFHFIDAEGNRTEQLRQITREREDVFIHRGDCNEILPTEVFPRARFADYSRALCLLDPYNIDLSWSVVAEAGKMRSVDLFLNFMIMDINMNVLLRDPTKIYERQIDRMNRFWGDDSWRQIAYDKNRNLFDIEEKVIDNEALARAYQKRLKDIAGFRYVPAPIPMRNKNGATIYYLFFASAKETASNIVEYIFNLYRNREM